MVVVVVGGEVTEVAELWRPRTRPERRPGCGRCCPDPRRCCCLYGCVCWRRRQRRQLPLRPRLPRGGRQPADGPRPPRSARTPKCWWWLRPQSRLMPEAEGDGDGGGGGSEALLFLCLCVSALRKPLIEAIQNIVSKFRAVRVSPLLLPSAAQCSKGSVCLTERERGNALRSPVTLCSRIMRGTKKLGGRTDRHTLSPPLYCPPPLACP